MLKNVFVIAALLILPVVAFAGNDSIDIIGAQEKPFVKKRYTIHGSAKIETVDGETQLIFSEDFKTKNGPDLKVFLSKFPLDALSSENVGTNSVRLSVLKSHKGPQNYAIPANIDLSDYESVIIHCETFTVLWGGFDL